MHTLARGGPREVPAEVVLEKMNLYPDRSENLVGPEKPQRQGDARSFRPLTVDGDLALQYEAGPC